MLADVGLEEPAFKPWLRWFQHPRLATYLTAGPKECAHGLSSKGYTAPQAAGVIHTDFEKGFIKADIVS